jgi:hypothetical protein
MREQTPTEYRRQWCYTCLRRNPHIVLSVFVGRCAACGSENEILEGREKDSQS